MTDVRIPQLPGIDPRDYAIDFTGNVSAASTNSTQLEQLLRDLVQYTVAGSAVGARTVFPYGGLIATNRTILVPFTKTDVGGNSNARLLDAYGCRIVPNFAYGDVIKFYIPQTLVGSGGIADSSSATTFNVTGSPDFDFSTLATPFDVVCGAETLSITNVSGNSWTSAARASHAPHSQWAPIALKITAGWMAVNGLAVSGTNAPAAVATTTLNTAISSSAATSIVVDAPTGGSFPIDSPFSIFVSDGTHEEQMLVTAGVTNSGTQTWTVSRNYGGSGSAQSSISAGATITMQNAMFRLHGSATTSGGTWLHKFTFRDLNFQEHLGHGLVQEGNTFENAVITPHLQAASGNTLGANLLLQNIGAAGVSSTDIYGGTLTNGRRGLHSISANDVKVFGGTYLSAYKEGIAAISSFNTAIYGPHIERNYTSGIAKGQGDNGSGWDSTSTSQAGILLTGGGIVSGVHVTTGTYSASSPTQGKQRYAVRVVSNRPLTIQGGYCATNVDYFARIEGDGTGQVTIIGVRGGDANAVTGSGGGSTSTASDGTTRTGVYHTSGTTPIVEMQNSSLDGIKIDGTMLSFPLGNSSLANMTAKTVKMRHTNSTGAPEDATMANLMADLSGQAGADFSFGGFKAIALGAGTTSGHALVFGLNDISNLAAATGPYEMGGTSGSAQKITGLAAGTNQKDAIRVDQRVDPLAGAIGLKAWNANPLVGGTNTAPVSKTIYACAIWIPPGITLTGVVLECGVVAQGTKPTGFWVGIASDDGAGTRTMRAQSNDLSGASGAPFGNTGLTQCAFNATYTTSAAHSPGGLYHVVLLADLTTPWGTANPQFTRGAGVAPTSTYLLYSTGGTAATALPANSSAITLAATGSPFYYYVGVY